VQIVRLDIVGGPIIIAYSNLSDGATETDSMDISKGEFHSRCVAGLRA
jgi:hypothetical protein